MFQKGCSCANPVSGQGKCRESNVQGKHRCQLETEGEGGEGREWRTLRACRPARSPYGSRSPCSTAFVGSWMPTKQSSMLQQNMGDVAHLKFHL